MARVLGSTNLGKIAFARGILAYFMIVPNWGLDVLGTRMIARKREKFDELVNHFLTLRFFLGIVAFLLLCLFVHIIEKPFETRQLILLFGLSLIPFSLLLEWFFQGVEKMEFIGLSRAVGKLVILSLVFFLIDDSQQLLLVPVFWLAGGVAASGFLIALFFRQYGAIRFCFDRGLWRDLLKRALPLGFSFFMVNVYYSFDIVMLGFLKDDEVVGWYAVAHTIVLFLIGILSLFIKTIFPLMSNYYRSSEEKLKSLISNSVRLLSLVALPIGISGTLLAKPILRFFFGVNFDGGVVALQILIWSVVVVFIRSTFGHSFLAGDGEKRYMVGAVLGCFTNIFLNVLLIPRFSLNGAAIASVVGEFVFFLYIFFYFQIVKKKALLKHHWKLILAGILMGMILISVQKIHVFLAILLGCTAYVLFALLLRYFTIGQIVKLSRQIFGREVARVRKQGTEHRDR